LILENLYEGLIGGLPLIKGVRGIFSSLSWTLIKIVSEEYNKKRLPISGQPFFSTVSGSLGFISN
jgi:hypothetical protein